MSRNDINKVFFQNFFILNCKGKRFMFGIHAIRKTCYVYFRRKYLLYEYEIGL